ncbi:MAG: hypothetical protein DWQ04_20790, partial [Chloroflexi bacterium]
ADQTEAGRSVSPKGPPERERNGNTWAEGLYNKSLHASADAAFNWQERLVETGWFSQDRVKST